MIRWWVAAAALAAVIADNTITSICFSLLGDNVRETNPFSRYLIGFWGVPLTMIANAFWFSVIVVYFTKQNSRLSLVVLLSLTVIRGYAAVNNYLLLSALA